MVVKAVIDSGASISGILNFVAFRVTGIIMPAAWTTAVLTFQASYDGLNFYDVYDEAGAEISITAAASRYIGIDASAMELSGLRYLKVRSGTTGSPVTQAAERTLFLVIG